MKKSCLSILTAFLLLWSSQVFALDASHDFFQKKDITRRLKKANMHYIQTPNPNSNDFLPVVKRLVRLNNQEFHSIVGVHTNNLERSKTVFYAVGEKKKIKIFNITFLRLDNNYWIERKTNGNDMKDIIYNRK